MAEKQGVCIVCNGEKTQVNKEGIKVLCPVCGGTGLLSIKPVEVQTKTYKYKKAGFGPFSTYVANSWGINGTMSSHVDKMLKEGWTIASQVSSNNGRDVTIIYVKK